MWKKGNVKCVFLIAKSKCEFSFLLHFDPFSPASGPIFLPKIKKKKSGEQVSKNP